MENHETDTGMVLSTRWMNECIGSFYDEKSKKFFTSSDPKSAISFEREFEEGSEWIEPRGDRRQVLDTHQSFHEWLCQQQAAKVEMDPNLEWTMLSYKTYRSIDSEVPLRQAEESLETKTGDSLGVVGKESIVLQLGQFHRRSIVVNGLDVDLLLGLVWYERYEDFVFDMMNDVLKTGLKRSSPIQARFRCSMRPRLRV